MNLSDQSSGFGGGSGQVRHVAAGGRERERDEHGRPSRHLLRPHVRRGPPSVIVTAIAAFLKKKKTEHRERSSLSIAHTRKGLHGRVREAAAAQSQEQAGSSLARRDPLAALLPLPILITRLAGPRDHPRANALLREGAALQRILRAPRGEVMQLHQQLQIHFPVRLLGQVEGAPPLPLHFVRT